MKQKYRLFLNGLVIRIQDVLTQWYNGGIPLFSVFSRDSLLNYHIDNYEAQFESLVTFLLTQKLVDSSMISSWRSEYPSFARCVVEEVKSRLRKETTIMKFWIESTSLTNAPSFRCIWDNLPTVCVLGADVTESQHFENENIDFDVHVSPAEFQWGVEIVRLHQSSWQDEKDRGVWRIPPDVETHLRALPEKIEERKLLHGDKFLDVQKLLFERDLIQYQLRALRRLQEQGVSTYSDLSPRKLRAIQLVLGIFSQKMPTTLELSKARLERRLAVSISQLTTATSAAKMSHCVSSTYFF